MCVCGFECNKTYLSRQNAEALVGKRDCERNAGRGAVTLRVWRHTTWVELTLAPRDLELVPPRVWVGSPQFFRVRWRLRRCLGCLRFLRCLRCLKESPTRRDGTINLHRFEAQTLVRVVDAQRHISAARVVAALGGVDCVHGRSFLLPREQRARLGAKEGRGARVPDLKATVR